MDGTRLPTVPLLGMGRVHHRRLRPSPHRFDYPSYFLMLPMRSLREQADRADQAPLRRNRFGLLSFHDRDHGDGGPDSLQWLDGLLLQHGVADAQGEVWLLCFPRVLGYVFKPVSFWYCHRADGSLRAIVVEVNNTFGERHCYLLDSPQLAYGHEQQADKVFHVSPFCAVAGSYRFNFMHSQTQGLRTVARITHEDGQGPLLLTSISGTLAPLSPQRVRQAFFGMPLMTVGLILRIHWQALRLWLKRVPLFRKPAPPQSFVTR
nr:DUF1365 domain-containing protein [uncultured Roseateles sp.]